MNRGKNHWTAKKLRAQYKSGNKNFRQADLSGQSFRGEDLSGADFSGADIRATDFTQAKLVGANFRDAQIGGTRWSACLTIVCCTVLATISTSTFLGADADYLLKNIIGIPTGFLLGCITLEIIAYFTLTTFFILKSPQNKRLVASVTAIAITLVASISIFLTAAVSTLVGMLIAVMVGALFSGIWSAALMMKHYSKPGINGWLFLPLLWLVVIVLNYMVALSTSGTRAAYFTSCLALDFRLWFIGFMGCYFLTAAAATFSRNNRFKRLNPTVCGLIVAALLAWFLFNLWIELTPTSAFDQYMVLSVGGAGLISSLVLAVHLSLPGNLATGRLPWLFQRFTSFHGADLTDALFSNTHADTIQTRSSSTKPFHYYWYLFSLIFSLATAAMLMSQVTLDTSTRSQLSPWTAANLLHNAASVQQRVLPLKRGLGQTNAGDNNNTETKKAEAVISRADSFLPRMEEGNGIALSAEGNMLAVGTTHAVMLYELPSGKLIRSFESHSDRNRMLYFTEGNRHLIDITYTLTYSDSEPADAYTHIYKEPEEEKKEIFLWNIASGEQINKIVQVPYNIKVLDDVAVTFGPTTTQQQNIYTGNPVGRFPALAQVTEGLGSNCSSAFYFSANRSVLTDLSSRECSVASLESVDKVVAWDLQTGVQLSEFDPEGRGLATVSPSGRFFAIYYDRDPSSALYTFNELQRLQSLEYSFIDVWDISTQSIVHTFPTLSGFKFLQMSEDDNVLIGYGHNAFQVWDLQQDTTYLFPAIMPITINRWEEQSVAMSHDGKVISTLSPTGKVAFVWHLP